MKASEAFLSPVHTGEVPGMLLSLVSGMEQGHCLKQLMDLHFHSAPTPEHSILSQFKSSDITNGFNLQ